jgi:hypothetical protein
MHLDHELTCIEIVPNIEVMSLALLPRGRPGVTCHGDLLVCSM